jgi:hypothetical protein
MTDNRMQPTETNRMEILHKLRQEIVRRYWALKEITKDIKTLEDKTKKLQLGDLVLIQLTPRQRTMLAHHLKISPKLYPEWSLPMRVTHLNIYATTATVQCLSSGYTTQTHVKRTKLIAPHMTDKLKNEWESVMKSEKTAYQILSSRYRDTTCSNEIQIPNLGVQGLGRVTWGLSPLNP